MLRSFSKARRVCRGCNAPTALRRTFAAPTSRRNRPAEAFATPEDDFHFTELPYTSSNSSAAHDRYPYAFEHPIKNHYQPPAPFTEDNLTLLPPPLPDDLPPSQDQSGLYPPSSLLDSLSLIHICLSKQDTIPRAYDIFSGLVADHTAGRTTLPDAKVWASVIQGLLSLVGQKKSSSTKSSKTSSTKGSKDLSWLQTASSLIAQWEELNGGRTDPQSSRPRPMGLNRDGQKVYQGYLLGLYTSGSSLSPILPYLSSTRISLTSMLADLAVEEREKVLDQLKKAAEEEADEGALKAIKVAIGMEEERKVRLERGVTDEVNPLYAKEPFTTALMRQLGDAQDPDSPLPRFAIANLRATFRNIPADDLPLRRQELLETASLAAARAELENAAQLIQDQGLKQVADSQRLQRGKLQAWMWQWSKDLSARLAKDIEALEKKTSDPNNKAKAKAAADTDLLLYLRLLSPEKMALVTILEVMRSSGAGGIADGLKTLRGLIQVGKAIETEYRAATIQNMLGKDSRNMFAGGVQSGKDNQRAVNRLWQQVGKASTTSEKANEADKQRIANLDHSHAMEVLRKVWTPDWTQQKHVAVGAVLMNALVDTAKIERTMTDEDGVVHSEFQPAFSHSYEYVRGNKLGVITLNPEVASRMAKDSVSLVVHPKHMPMLIPPRRWAAHDDGAYLFHKVSAMRFKESAEQGSYLRAASDAGRLEGVFRGLDVLSSTPWRINRDVFEVVLTCWNRGEAIADMPASEENSEYPIVEKPDPDDPDPAVRSMYVAKMRDLQAQIKKDHSERCKFNYNLELARSFLNDVFYIPHNLDFRGRAYPVPPHLNPVGDDLCRGLLTFGEKKPLGERGLMWLRIHLANLYGFDKASFKEREQFAIDHEADILDSVDRPLDGNRWWAKAEDPWQCLATCYELAGAIRSGKPFEYLSSLPVHQDGTCNGMQHYAALGGDVQGAKAVNLVGGDRPADVYTRIADLVNEIVNQDAEAGKVYAQIAQCKITRKVVKQTVMTTVYGVTFIGAKEQIAKQLLARGEINREYIYHVSGYIASTVLSCIGDLFSGAKAIQDWLTLSARMICKSFPLERAPDSVRPLTAKYTGNDDGVVLDKSGKVVTRVQKEAMTSVIWTTPLGLPVVQPYRKTTRKQVATALQSVYISDPNAVSEVASGKQASAMPPNFIHSLDATHMLMCAARCRDDGVTFASVHDSYWSHASSIDQLSSNIRETFIELHSRDIIGDLRKEFIERYKDHVIPVKSAREILSANKKKLSRREAQADNDAELDESAEDVVPEPVRRNNPSSAFISAEGESKDKIEIGTRQFVRFTDALPFTPTKGDFDVNNIRSSPYFFS